MEGYITLYFMKYFDDYGVAFYDGFIELVKEKSLVWEFFLLSFCISNDNKFYIIILLYKVKISSWVSFLRNRSWSKSLS